MEKHKTGSKADQSRKKKIKRQIAKTARREEKDFLTRLMKFGRILEADIENGLFN